jgi:dTDP-glucose pyrophosphorylase/predicted transcriptional regulator
MKQKYIIKQNASIKMALKKMKKNGIKSLFIIDDQSILIGSISGGDIRGALLKKMKIKESIRSIINYAPKFVLDEKPASINKKLKDLFQKFKIEEIPIVNQNKNIIKVVSWTDFYKNKLKQKKIIKLSKYDLKVVIMAGGKGSRLKPFTDILPKPLIPVKNKTIIEHIINSFTKFDIKKLTITTNYKSEIIKSYLDKKYNKNYLKFINETKPLGTVGSLNLVQSNRPFLVSNCDVLHKFKLNKFIEFHFKNQNDISMVVANKKRTIPYGVCQIDKNNNLLNLKEKPSSFFLINTGLYFVNHKIIKLIPRNKYFDFNDLIKLSLQKKKKIGVFKIKDNEWHDIGKWDEFSKTINNL